MKRMKNLQINRIDSFFDARFSRTALLQHGCFLVDDVPYEVEIVSDTDAIVRGTDCRIYEAIIDEFRFYAPHITRFFTSDRNLIREFTPKEVLQLRLEQIQPSQFYVDREKLTAVSSFIEKPEDIVIQVLPHAERYISLDGHTRLYYAVIKGWNHVYAVAEPSDEWVHTFVEEAVRRNIRTPMDMELVTHQEYEVKWNQFCDSVFEKEEKYSGQD